MTNAQFAAFFADTGHLTLAERRGGGEAHTAGGWNFIDGADWQHPQGPSTDPTGVEGHPVGVGTWGEAEDVGRWRGGALARAGGRGDGARAAETATGATGGRV